MMLVFRVILSKSKYSIHRNEEIRKEWIKPLIISDVAIKAKKFSERHIPYFAKADGTIDTQ